MKKSETIRVDVETPKPKGDGLKQVMQDLRNIDAYLGQINRKLSGISEPVLFKKSAREFQTQLAAAMKSSSVGLKPADVSKALGLDPRLFTDFVRQGKSQLSKLFSGSEFRSVPAAAKAAFQFNKQQMELQTMLRQNVGNFFGGGRNPLKPTQAEVDAAGVHARLVGKLSLEILPSQIQAVLGPGMVQLVIPGNQVTGGAGGGASAAGGSAGSVSGAKPFAPTAEANELKRVITQTKRGAQTTITNALNDLETLATTYKPDGSASKSVRTQRSGAKEQFANALKLERELMTRNLASVSGGTKAETLRGKATVLGKAASSMEELVKEHAEKLTTLGFGPAVEQMRARVDTLKAKAAAASRAAGEAELKALEQRVSAEKKSSDANSRSQMRGKQAFGRIQEEAANARDAELRDEIRAKRNFGQVQEKSNKAREKWVKEQAAAQALLDSEEAARMKVGEGRAALQQLLRQGYQVKETKKGSVTRGGNTRATESVVLGKDEGGQRFGKAITFEFDKNGRAVAASMSETAKALREVRTEAAGAGKEFFRNTLHVTAWAASVGTLYSALNLAGSSLKGLVETGYQTARLTQVFEESRGKASELRDNIMALAAANGRSTDEALEAATAWARLNLSRAQTIEAVRVSLVGANVAELSAAESTKYLQAVMAAYGLQVGQLNTVLGEMNQISNTWNVRVRDMMEGLARTASVAKQAGIPLAELMGIVGGTVGTTGQTGANIGNALKSITVAMSNPEIQKFLRREFKIEPTTDGGGEIKDMSAMLSDLFISYQKLSNAERQHLLFQVAGKTQASRMAAVLDAYIRSQTLAINAQLNLNSAQQENEKILATLKSQLVGVSTQWDLFVTRMAGGRALDGMSGLAKGLRNLFKLGSTETGTGVMQGMTLLMGALSARMIVTHVQMAKMGKEGSIVSNTWARAKSAGSGFVGTLKDMKQSLYSVNQESWGLFQRMQRLIPMIDNYGKRWIAMGRLQLMLGSKSFLARGRARGMAVGENGLLGIGQISAGLLAKGAAGALALGRLLLPMGVALGAIGVATWGFNAAMEAAGRSSDGVLGKLDEMTRRAEEFRSASEGYAQSARLFDTLRRSLPNMRSGKERSAAVEQLADVGMNQRRLEALKLAVKQNDQAAYNAILEEQSAEARAKSANARQQEYLTNKKQSEELAQRIKEVESNPLSDKSHLKNLEGKQQELANQRVRLLFEQTEDINDAYQQTLAVDQKHQINLERQKALLESIAEIYESLPTLGNTGRVASRTAAVGAAKAADEALMARLENEDRNDAASRAMQDEAREAIDEKIKAARDKLAKVQSRREMVEQAQRFSEYQAPDSGFAAQEKDIRDSIASLEAERSNLERSTMSGDAVRRKAEKKDVQERLYQYERDLAKQKAKMEAAALMDRGASAREEEQAMMGGYGVGRNRTEQLLNTKASLEKRRGELERHIAQWGFTNSTEIFEQRNRLAQVYLEISKTTLEIKQREGAVGKEIVELELQKKRVYESSLMKSGPEDLLRKLAALRMSAKGMTSGHFFSLSPDMRQEVMDTPRSAFDPDLQRLVREREELERRGGLDYMSEQRALQEAAAKNTPGFSLKSAQASGFEHLAVAGREAMVFANSLKIAAQSLEALNTVPAMVNAIAAAVAKIPGAGGGDVAVKIPQGGGHAVGLG